jgi:predicted dehydrogenase
VRVGVIGRGFGERVVVPALQATEGCEVVELASPRDADQVRALCRRTDLDLVSIHSPPFLHLQHVRLAIDSGHDVLCDKPFGRNAQEAAEMVEIARAADVLRFVNFENRYDAARRHVVEAITDGSIGAPEHASFTLLMSITRVPLRPYGWIFDAEAGGGWLRAMGSHQIDFARWAFGELGEVDGQLRTAITERPDAQGVMHPCTADDGFTATMRSDRGVSVVMDGSSAAPVNIPLSLVVLGSRGVVQEVGNRIVVRTPEAEVEVFSSQPGGNPLLAAMQRFVGVIRDAIRDREAPADAPTFDDGLACAIVMDRVAANGAMGGRRE